MSDESDDLLVEQRGGTLFLTLNAPTRRNALSASILAGLHDVASKLPDDRSVRCVVLRGAGGVFCAGGDVSGFDAAGRPDRSMLQEGNRGFGRLLTKLDGLPQTVLAVVEGYAFGGGLGLLCIADTALSCTSARFAISETRLGLPPAQIAPFLVRKIGFSQTRHLALTGETFDAQRACALGLVHKLAADTGELDRLVDMQLELISRCAPRASAVTKRLLRLARTVDDNELLDLAAAEFASCIMSSEGSEGAAAFLAKRKANWAA